MNSQSMKHVILSMAEKKYMTKELAQYRKALLANVNGRILELGIGTGVNLEYYPTTVSRIISVEPNMLKLRTARLAVDQYYGTYEQLPFETESFDTVVTTFTLSSIVKLTPVLEEIKRVLKPRGRLIFMECGKSQDVKTAMLQELLSPVYEIGRHTVINRDYFCEIKSAGYIIANEVCREIHISPKFAYGTMYTGVALKVE